ncbi:hypothetical protein AB0D73_26955 [Streptomyces sp. NPDC048215]|uniref:hypothetical protein n=1 Tax=Streptomyces sp. NPDC048215 TaxID=3156690 RepID=UPI0033F25DB3
MDKPKQRYPQSEANRLRAQPCPDCGRKSFPDVRKDEGAQTNPLDPEVNVTWYCPSIICDQNDGFWIESR